MKIHYLASTQLACAMCQEGNLGMGDILVIESELVVGIADADPFAITVQTGQLRRLPSSPDGNATRTLFAASIDIAARIARDLARKVDAGYEGKAAAIAQANTYLRNLDLPDYGQLARAAAAVAHRHPAAGTEDEGNDLSDLRLLIQRIPCIELDGAAKRTPAART